MKGIFAVGPFGRPNPTRHPQGGRLPRFAAADRVTFSARGPRVDVEIMRLVLEGPPKPRAAHALLQEAFARWPQGRTARFLITPGAFIEATWPGQWQGTPGWDARPEELQPLVRVAEHAARQVLTPSIRAAARGKVRYLTLAVDVTTDQKMKGPHAELVGVYDVTRDRFAGWTGKSYPLAVQEDSLVHVTDTASHLLELDGERVMVLGCHDLNMFSPRAYANQAEGSRRRERTEAMRAKAQAFGPTIILQHPHGTDTPNIWLLAWRAIEKQFPDLKAWASAIGFYNFLNPTGSTRASLEKTLRQTQSGNGGVENLVIDTRQFD